MCYSYPAPARAPASRRRPVDTKLLERLLNVRLQSSPSCFQIAAPMNPQRSSPALSQPLEISARLRRLPYSEAVFLAWNLPPMLHGVARLPIGDRRFHGCGQRLREGSLQSAHDLSF